MKWRRWILLTILLLSLCGCAQRENASGGTENDTGWGITLSARKVTPTGMTLVISQSGGAPTGRLEYGSGYELQVLDGETWVDVPTITDGEVAWTLIGYEVPMEDRVKLKLSWEELYGSLEAGTYRISKEFMDVRGTGDYDTQRFYAEFEVK